MDINYFYNLTPRQYYNIVKGKEKKQEFEIQISWEQVRTIIYYNYLMQPTKGSKKSAEHILPFIWDKKHKKGSKAKLSTTAEIAARFKKNRKAQNKTGSPKTV